jgi:hypothetical protein
MRAAARLVPIRSRWLLYFVKKFTIFGVCNTLTVSTWSFGYQMLWRLVGFTPNTLWLEWPVDTVKIQGTRINLFFQ